jgi:hypothetical protein
MQALAAYNNRSNPTEELGYTDTFEINWIARFGDRDLGK